MIRRSSLVARAIWAVTTFSTVWCLGCSAFEPIMFALTNGRASSEMDCGGGPGNVDTEATIAAATSGASSGLITVSSATSDESDGEFNCGCALCHFASLRDFAIVAVDRAAPDVQLLAHVAPPSVDYSPLVPPPQFLI